jgi:hypothetical protein
LKWSSEWEDAVITKERWEKLASANHEARADAIEKEFLDPQIAEGRVIPHRNYDEVAMVRLPGEPQEVIDVLRRRAKAAGWRDAVRDERGWFFVYV